MANNLLFVDRQWIAPVLLLSILCGSAPAQQPAKPHSAPPPAERRFDLTDSETNLHAIYNVFGDPTLEPIDWEIQGSFSLHSYNSNFNWAAYCYNGDGYHHKLAFNGVATVSGYEGYRFQSQGSRRAYQYWFFTRDVVGTYYYVYVSNNRTRDYQFLGHATRCPARD